MGVHPASLGLGVGRGVGVAWSCGCTRQSSDHREFIASVLPDSGWGRLIFPSPLFLGTPGFDDEYPLLVHFEFSLISGKSVGFSFLTHKTLP